MVRLFIAIDFNVFEDYFFKLQESLKEIKGLSFPKTFHLTLKFIGEVDEKNLEQIKNSLRKIQFNKFDISLSGPGAFPDNKRPRVLWIGLSPEEEINNLGKKIDQSLSDYFPKENKFHPHITIARVKFIEDLNKIAGFFDSLPKALKMTAENFQLIKSDLTPKGPIYTVLETFELN